MDCSDSSIHCTSGKEHECSNEIRRWPRVFGIVGSFSVSKFAMVHKIARVVVRVSRHIEINLPDVKKEKLRLGSDWTGFIALGRSVQT